MYYLVKYPNGREVIHQTSQHPLEFLTGWSSISYGYATKEELLERENRQEEGEEL